VCHGCRLCYSLCDSFPRLFDLIDDSKTGELDSVPSSDFKKVVDACTLCDICFMNKCPYTPPHGLNVDFPHLILRMKALDNAKANTKGVTLETPKTFASVKESSGTKLGSGSSGLHGSVHVEAGVDRKLSTQPESLAHSVYTNMDFMSPLASKFSPILNWLIQLDTQTSTTSTTSSSLVRTTFRTFMQRIFDIHPTAKLPAFVPPSERLTSDLNKALTNEALGSATESNSKHHHHAHNPYRVDKSRKAYTEKRRVIIYATCHGNYNKPNAANAFRAILAKHGIFCQVEYEGCCGMPQLESGRVKDVAEKAKSISERLREFVDMGYDVVTPVSSCSLMFKKEWPLLEPDNGNIRALSENTYDMSEYLVKLQKEGYLDPIPALDESVTLHHACHARAQNMGFKSQQLLESVPNLNVASIERCSGHGGSFGVQTEGHRIAMKVGRPVFSKTLSNAEETAREATHYVASDCPLAMEHILQGVSESAKERRVQLAHSPAGKHPVELVAMAYGITL